MTTPHMAKTAERPGDVLVPVVDVQDAARVYDRSILWFTLIGLLLGALVLGLLGAAIATRTAPVAGLGQIAAGGSGPAVVASGGLGAALGGCIGGILAMLRLPPRRPPGPPMGEAAHRHS